MKTEFINREGEINYLRDEYTRSGASLVVIYGRRRLGKTTLIKRFIKDKEALYFIATEESEKSNKRGLRRALADFTGNAMLKKDMDLEWEEIFELFCDYKSDSRKILVIDEFQYLSKGNKAFPSVFQKIWDERLSGADIMVILCGSLVSLMISQTLSYSSPLYGRRTGQIKLKQIPFKHYGEFFKERSDINLVEYYSVTGGIPKYIELFRPAADIFEVVRANIFSRQSFLYEEPFFLLEKEVGEIGAYFSIMKSIAASNHKIGKLAADLKVSQSGITKYLKTLGELDLIARIVPATEKNPEKSKKGLYFIKDNFIKFWFRFVYPYRNYLEIENHDPVVAKLKQNFIDNHVSFVYEDICLEKLMDLSGQGAFDFEILKSGKWWNKDEEIDIIGLNEEGNRVIFGECKYTRQKADADIYFKLREKAKKVKLRPDCRKRYIIFSYFGFSETLIKLADKEERLYLQS